MKFIKSKLSLILICIAMLLFFTNDFGLVDIERTAIIVALGIDYEEESGDYDVTAQIAIPQASNTTISNQDSLVCGKGGTIAAALDNIGINTGWYPMLAFCNLILIGKNALKDDVMDHVNYFIRSDRIEDSAILAACEDEAREVLSSKTAIDTISSLAIQKILSRDVAKSDKIADTDVKEFSKGYYSKSESSYMPYIKRIKLENTMSNNENSGQNGSGKSGGKTGSSGQNEEYVFDATNTLIFNKGKPVAELNSLETLLFNFEYKNSKDTFIEFDDVEYQGKKTCVILGVNEGYKKYSFTISDDKPLYTVKICLLCQIEDIDDSVSIDELVTTTDIDESIKSEAKKRLVDCYNGLFDKLKTSGCDLFNFREQLYKYHYPHYEKWQRTVLEDTAIDIEVILKPEQSAKM